MAATTRQVEPEWDAESRALAEALAAYDADCCPGCGLHKSLFDDPEANQFAIDDRTCTVCAGLARHARKASVAEEVWRHANKPPDPDAPPAAHLKAAGLPRPGDGVHTYLKRRLGDATTTT